MTSSPTKSAKAKSAESVKTAKAESAKAKLNTMLRLLAVCLALIAVSVYLFSTAPPMLREEAASGVMVDVQRLFEILEHENDVARSLYTSKIVNDGKKGLFDFGEDWKRRVGIGPLPASFLRETALALEQDPTALSLFLGSDRPIVAANIFVGDQSTHFKELAQTRQPVFFYSLDIEREVGMFPDVAIADACVTCHNNDERSAFRKWKKGDVMGATSWMYPSKTLPLQEALHIVRALRNALYGSFTNYLERTKKFAVPPSIGTIWPVDGYGLPSTEQFAEEHKRQASTHTLQLLFGAAERTL